MAEALEQLFFAALDAAVPALDAGLGGGAGESEQVLGRLDVHSHLVAVVLAAVVEAVHG